MHWDTNLDNRPVGFGVQGVLYLTDTAENQGAFQCVPGFPNIIEDWLDALPEGEDPHRQDLHALGSIRVPASAGDLIIWRTSLPHFASLNTSNRPRIVQYITMNPANDGNQAACQSRVNWWQERLTGLGKNAKEKEHYHSKTAKLTPLGQKLLGMDKWD
jgi:ectoine hydroxylase-related dioxygenase (phytanoyl-CoA dioxygenase family)